jgi:hypothetical protein
MMDRRADTLTPTFSRKGERESMLCPLSRLRERAGVRVAARVNVIATHYTA